MRYGIPDFKLEKRHIDLRVKQMEAEGVTFHYDAHIGVTVMGQSLVEEYDAIALAGGSKSSRDLPVPGRDLDGVHFAMEFLPQQNRRVSNEPIGTNASIVAAGKRVVVIGGGDTGSDCIGTSIRQGALKVTQLEIMPMPPKQEDKMLTWPNWPLKLRTSSSHEEGAERDFAVNTVAFEGDNGAVTGLQCVRIDEKMKPIAGTEFTLPADLVLLAMGFVSPVKDGLLAELGVSLDARGNVLADTNEIRRLEIQGLCLRRHAPRPVARRVGYPRRPAMRRSDRRGPNGLDGLAEVAARLGPFGSSYNAAIARAPAGIGAGDRGISAARTALDRRVARCDDPPSDREATRAPHAGMRSSFGEGSRSTYPRPQTVSM